mmetsp:Transcript_7422/g.10945  ORF Transcript_7422/g.10945 Transcript_7422/m.10945 type:complete len:140 (-) Transcript_7422:64-483(-)
MENMPDLTCEYCGYAFFRVSSRTNRCSRCFWLEKLIYSMLTLILQAISLLQNFNSNPLLIREITKKEKRSLAKRALIKCQRISYEQLPQDLSQCAICTKSFTLKRDIRVLPCGHIFHKVCVEKWFFERVCCPLCRHKLD